jgi:aconitate hydratase
VARRIQPDGEVVSVYDAAMEQAEVGQPLVIVAGAEYGTGSSRDWAAKGTRLLGVRAVIAESFERIHRSNLIGMGVLPLQFAEAIDRHTLGIDGSETFDIDGVASLADGTVEPFDAVCRIDTDEELAYFRHGGILPFVLRQLL